MVFNVSIDGPISVACKYSGHRDSCFPCDINHILGFMDCGISAELDNNLGSDFHNKDAVLIDDILFLFSDFRR